MVNENDHIRHLGHISHLTVLFFVLSALNKYEWKKKKKSWNILQELWVFFSLWLLKFIVAFSQCKINSPQSVFYTAFFAVICACLGYANNLFCLLAFFLIY